MGARVEDGVLDRAKHYDREALGDIYQRYYGVTFYYLYKRIGNRQVCEDLASTVFVRMLEAIRSGQTWRSNFSGWLGTIARNVMVDELRGPWTRALPLEELLGSPSPDAEEQVEQAELVEAAWRALPGLTKRQRRAVEMHYLQEMEYPEMAQDLRSNYLAVRCLTQRGIVAMRERVGP